jgi:hypothetical protein
MKINAEEKKGGASPESTSFVIRSLQRYVAVIESLAK